MAESHLAQPPSEFSLVMGGPLFQLLRKSHLAGDSLGLLHRRLLVITALAWLPLVLLTTFDSSGGSAGRLSFFHDIEVHVRFLVALPALIAAELIVHLRLRPAVRRFVEGRLVRAQDLPLFHGAIDAAVRLRNSIPVEIGLVVVVYSVGLWVWHSRIALDTATWYARPGGRWQLTAAGYWYVFVSIPIVQFILLRWYLRVAIWYRFLWQVSKFNLNLLPGHPDRAAGLAFLGKSVYAFGPILFAQGAMLAGLVASRVLNRGEALMSFRLEAGGFVAFFVCAMVSPLLMFTPAMARAKRKGLAEYGLLAQRYIESFEQRWIVRDPAPSHELLGTDDIQSLADLGNSYGLVRDMRRIPFGLDDITRLAAATAAPLLPLALTVLSLEELIIRFVDIVF